MKDMVGEGLRDRAVRAIVLEVLERLSGLRVKEPGSLEMLLGINQKRAGFSLKAVPCGFLLNCTIFSSIDGINVEKPNTSTCLNRMLKP